MLNCSPSLFPSRLLPLGLTLAALAPAWFSPAAHAQCPLSFAAEVRYPAPNRPFAIGVGDFNGDGWPDMAVAKSGGVIAIMLGNPPPNAGTFQAPINYAAGGLAFDMAVADLNGDGWLDLATANSATSVSVLLGNGDGTFRAPFIYTGLNIPSSIAVGDFNGDGRPDLAVAADYGNDVSILLGNPAPNAGTFQPAVHYAVGNRAFSVAVGDLNGDGRLDLAVAKGQANTVAILLGNGNGTFSAPVDLPVDAPAMSVAVGDFNADSKLDLAVSCLTGGHVAIFLGNGNGSFQAQMNYSDGGGGYSGYKARVTDFNGDGRPDLVIAHSGSNDLSILLGNGNGSFQTPTSYTVTTLGSRGFAVGDLNADGSPDLAISDTDGDNHDVVVLLNTTRTRATITQQPVRRTVLSGQSATFSVAAASTGPIAYQWRKDGLNMVNGGGISGATTPTLTINPVALADNGAAFDCFISSACGSVTSRPAGLTVADSCPADFNHDGINDFFDYLDFVAAFSAGC